MPGVSEIDVNIRAPGNTIPYTWAVTFINFPSKQTSNVFSFRTQWSDDIGASECDMTCVRGTFHFYQSLAASTGVRERYRDIKCDTLT